MKHSSSGEKGKGKERMDEKLGDEGGDEDKDKVPKVMEARNRKGEPELWIGGLRIQW